ncbi:probable ATP-dependent RNA helicase kurz isoform X2 [Ooceraea biroi]|uniref:probable ATP-dependent RNA helicase kurz isoform X2 n=1 Tax=Ooceraea biroi TaxID=2015173 RepID=UPI0005B8F81F|nr:probable ATP-dependent RNA helicase kurz isoform X2 [Ooceraea biroi]
MGKKRGYNWEARAGGNVQINDSTTNEIQVDIKHRVDHYDDCNTFVLPSKKRNTKKVDHRVTKTPLLSKKRRKELEKVIEKKKKKLQRAALLERLAKHNAQRASSSEQQHYVSVIDYQNKGRKRFLRELKKSEIKHEAIKEEKNCVETVPEIQEDPSEQQHESTTNMYESEMQHEADGIEENCDETVRPAKKRCRRKPKWMREPKKPDLSAVYRQMLAEGIAPENIIGFENYSDTSDDDVPDSTVAPKITPQQSNKTNEGLNKTVESQDVQIVAEPQKPVEIVPQATKVATPAVFVPVNRKPDIEKERLKLPICAEEQHIMETINDNPVVIITGETGSGKTTQVPQFLYEAGYARERTIGITEPRRVAAMSMSKRVAEEMNLTQDEVSYLIRFEGNVTDKTKIKFMTDGVLLQEIKTDVLLKKYSAIIVDEAHECSVHTDMLIGFLSRIVLQRKKRNDPLKVIIMSATLRIEQYIQNQKLFPVKPPLITIEGRQFPVKTSFNRQTKKDYVDEAFYRAVKIHKEESEGGILIFLTGQQEIHRLVNRLRKAFPLKKYNKIQTNLAHPEKNKTLTKETTNEESSEEDNSEDEFERQAMEALHRNKRRRRQHVLPTINLDDYSAISHDNKHEDSAQDTDEFEDMDGEQVMDFIGLGSAEPMWVLPLYSLLDSREQAKIFESPPEGCRLCVVATNIAETSLTIPKVRYVIDSGYCKVKRYDKVTGVSTFDISYISKAAAEQRAGRAGRTTPGCCYRLYSAAVFHNEFKEYDQPEIQRRPLDDLVLELKAMNLDYIMHFPFPTQPDIEQLKAAMDRLTILGALEPPKKKEEIYRTQITPLGRQMASFPVAPRYGKMLVLSRRKHLVKYIICVVAGLSVPQLFEAFGECKNKWLQSHYQWAGEGHSFLMGDLMVLLKAIMGAEHVGPVKNKLEAFCKEHGLRHKALVEARKLRRQLIDEINSSVPNSNLTIDPEMQPPSDEEAKFLRKVILAGMADQVAKKISPDEMPEGQKKTWKHAYRTPEMEEPVFMHSSCVLRQTDPEWVVYQEVYEVDKKMYMRGVTAIEPEWLPRFAPTLCNMDDPSNDEPPIYYPSTGKVMCRVSGTFGKAAWKLPMVYIEYPPSSNAVKWFACFFLEGEVCPKLKRFAPLLLSQPRSMTKSWAKFIPRTQAILQPLTNHTILCKDKVREMWDSDKRSLLTSGICCATFSSFYRFIGPT